MNVRPENKILQEINLGCKLLDISLGDGFVCLFVCFVFVLVLFWFDTKIKAKKKAKINNEDYIKFSGGWSGSGGVGLQHSDYV